MNNDYNDYSHYSACEFREAIENNQRRAREALAKKLTELRESLVNSSAAQGYRTGYLAALDAVARASELHTETTVRYIA